MRNWGRRALAIAIGTTLFLAACDEPDPPPPPPETYIAPAPGSPSVGTAAAPLDPMDAPDPTIITVDPSYCGSDAPSCYYAYTTQVVFLIAPLWRSTDLVNWSLADDINGSVMPVLAPWVQWGHNWAPSVLEVPGNPESTRFVMWYTAREDATGRQCLGVATASTPNGPFVDSSTKPAFCQNASNDTIDASTYIDTDGTIYLVYKTGPPDALWVSRLTPDAMTVVPNTAVMLLHGGAPDAGIVEAPTMIRYKRDLYLFYSTDDWWTDRYRVATAQCDAPTGPCRRMYDAKAVLASRGTMVGPGGQTPIQDTSGAWHLFFHAWTGPKVGYDATGARSLHILPLDFTGGIKVG
jgi:beta-xylosidase